MADLKLKPDQVALLRDFVRVCQVQPSVLQMPEMAFFREWLLKLGATLPLSAQEDIPVPSKPAPQEDIPDLLDPDDDIADIPIIPDNTASSTATAEESYKTPAGAEPQVESEESTDGISPDSELEVDVEGVVEVDEVISHKMGDPNKEVTEEESDKASELRSQAMAKSSEGDIEAAIELFTEGIVINPTSAVLYAKRASLYVRLVKPNAAMKDSTEAIRLNPDSAQGYKWRGKANALLGKWTEAAHDLQTALKIDYDSDTNDSLKSIKTKFDKAREHNQKTERKQRDRDLFLKKKRIKRAKKVRAENVSKMSEESANIPPGAGFGGGPGMGGMGGLNDVFNDPELIKMMQDPEVMAAFQESATNPEALEKYKDNPKVMAAMAKIQAKLGSMGGMGGMEGMEGMEGMGPP